MERSTRRITGNPISLLAILLLFLVGNAAEGAGITNTVQVNASAGAALPNPAAVQWQVSAPLTASVPNPPPAQVTEPGEPPQNCTVSGPTWSWSTQDPPAPQVPVVQRRHERGMGTGATRQLHAVHPAIRT